MSRKIPQIRISMTKHKKNNSGKSVGPTTLQYRLVCMLSYYNKQGFVNIKNLNGGGKHFGIVLYMQKYTND